MKKLITLLLTLLAVNANAAVLCQSPNGGLPYAPATLAAAATSASCKNTDVVVTTPQTLAGNLTWPTDRELKFEKGGYIVPNAYSLTGLKEARPEYFGVNTTPGTTDMSVALQRAIDSVISGDIVGKVILSATHYRISTTIEIKVRDTSYSVNGSIIEIAGAGGGSVPTYAASNTLITKTTSGPIFRICEESDGSYPGGGAGVVTNPLNYLRRVKIHDIDFQGDSANPNTVDAIVGRGVHRSQFYNLGFTYFRDGIRLGKRLAITQETSADSIELDYCERNEFWNLNMRQVNMMIHVIAGDINTVKNSYLSQCNDAGGLIGYFAGGNDFIDFENNIIHPIVHGGSTPLTYAFNLQSLRGFRMRGNHIETLHGKLLYGGTAEFVDIRNNLLTGLVQSTANIFELTLSERGQFHLVDNNIAMPAPSTSFVNLAVPGDDGSYTKLKTCSVRLGPNKITTTLGGTTTYAIGNAQSISEYSRWGAPINPGRTTDYYEWYSSGNSKKRIKYGSAPTSDTDGYIVGEDAFTNGTFSFAGVTVNAGAWATVAISITGAAVDRFVFVAPVVTLAGLSHSVHPTGSGTANIVFYNPTAGNITIAAGTWKYKVELN